MSKLFRSTIIVSLLTFLSRILGFIRDLLIARLFGTSIYADIFFIAFMLPTLARRLFTEGAFSQTLIPILTDCEKQPHHSAVTLTHQVMTTLGLLVTLLTSLAIIAAPILVLLLAPGFSYGSEPFNLTVDMLQLTLPYIIFLFFTALISALLNYHQQFGIAALTPSLLNITLICCALGLSSYVDPPVMALAWGVLLGGIVQLSLQFPFLLKLQGWPKFIFAWRNPQVQIILKRLLPIMFSASITQLNLLLDILLASTLISGSISWLYYADRLMQFPLGLLGVALAIVILPHLSQSHSQDQTQQFSDTLDWALRLALVFALPAALGLILLAQPILITLFQYGAFSAHDVNMTSLGLQAYTIGLLAFIIIKLLLPAYYAQHNTQTPTRIAIIALGFNLLLSLILLPYFAHIGLAFATSCAALLNAGLLFIYLQRKYALIWQPGWLLFLTRLLIANGMMSIILFNNIDITQQWLQWTGLERLYHLGLLIIMAITSYGLSLLILGLRPHQFRLNL